MIFIRIISERILEITLLKIKNHRLTKITFETMKRNIILTILTSLLLAFLILAGSEGCKKSDDSFIPNTQTSKLWLKGSVVNAETNQGIANANVFIAGLTGLTTDANGFYQVDIDPLSTGAWEVRAIANGFGYGSTVAEIGDNIAVVNVIRLKPLSAPVQVGSAGASLNVLDPEAIVPNSRTILNIPAGAFTQNTNVTLTRFTGNGVPGYAPGNMLNLGTVNLGPEGTITAVPVELIIPMPATNVLADNLPLLLYNPETNIWTITGLFAQVDHANHLATVHVTTFGTYSLGIEGSFTETAGTAGPVTKVSLDPDKSSIDFSYLALNNYPGGTPPEISLVYLKNVVSQNTIIHGVRTSFVDYTVVTVNYIGHKPDSLGGGKSTNAGYYRWIPEVSYNNQEMPMSITIEGTGINGIIQKEIFLDSSYWEYVHDQGGGGK
jgi:hypothetical protein